MRSSLSPPETVAPSTYFGTESKLVKLVVVLAVPRPSEAMFESDVVVVELRKVEADWNRIAKAL